MRGSGGVLASRERAAGVDKVSIDVWWSKVEARGDQRFDGGHCDTVFARVRERGLRLAPIISFHGCGGPGDDRSRAHIRFVHQGGARTGFTLLRLSGLHGRAGPPKQPLAMPDTPPLAAGLTLLGHEARVPASPADARLERVPNPEPGVTYLVRFTCPEFTTLCPVTGQPDFAHLVLDYVPGAWLLESKSLKLYLASFRNQAGFHEATTLEVGRRVARAVEPAWLRLGGYWYPRGGIPIDVFWQTGEPPAGLWLPDQGVPPYRGRG